MYYSTSGLFGCFVELDYEEKILSVILHVRPKWRLLGIILGVSQKDLSRIHGDPLKCLQKVISLWLSGQCSKQPTLECLTNALRSSSMKEDHIASAVEQGICRYYYASLHTFLVPVRRFTYPTILPPRV